MFVRGAKLSLARTRFLALAAVFLLGLPAATSLSLVAGSAPAVSIAAPIHGYRLVGQAPQDLPILVTLALPLRNLAALDSRVMQVSDPASPMYRHFLSNQQVVSEFLPTGAFESLVSYLNASGFNVVLTALDSEVVVQGTAAQFHNAFGGEINTYTNGTYSYYASAGAPTYQGAYVYASNATFLYAKPSVLSAPKPDSNVTFTEGSFSAKELQPVYNATSLYSAGFDGTGRTIGLLDYYGSPTISSDLIAFDRAFGFPDAKLNIIPVGPYDPNLGANLGWSTEVSLDVEASHAMAPGATIDLYVANGALPLTVPLAQIVSDDNVTTLSQSFGTFEWYYSLTSYLGGPSFFAMNAIIPDQYYALGSAEGISFLASSGDGGGSGYSSGPEGDLEYPASSPFVTSVGGTQTYVSQVGGSKGFVQTAWSNIGFVPNIVNEGGGGGGVSILEPKPWYQQGQVTPPSFPNGRLNPDLSLQAGVDPATMIVSGGSVIGTGGTSESSPLLAGLLALVSESASGGLGLVNPFIYGVGNSPAEYNKGFEPITFGYTVPWRASSGYNLATGWGAPNVGELANLLNAASPASELSIIGEVVNKTGGAQNDYTPGQQLTVRANITSGGARVTAGSFTVSLETLTGNFYPTPMTYNPTTGNWTASITVGGQSGLAYVYMTGASAGGVPGSALGVVFTGYLGSFETTGYFYILPIDPWTWDLQNPLSLTVFNSDINGNPAPDTVVNATLQPYSILTNQYSVSSVDSFTGFGSGAVTGVLANAVPPGPVSIVLGGDTYGYAPTVWGIYLQSSFIYPDVAAEPGSVAPGQYLTVIANPIAPVNVYFETSFETGRTFAEDVYFGSNVTASLVSPTGVNVSSATLAYQPCAQALRVCNGGASIIYGQLQVPNDATPGLYTVMLHASYGSFTPGGNLTGAYYSQVWVSGPALSPAAIINPAFITTALHPSCLVCTQTNTTLYEGEQAHVEARISYANGNPVNYGEFTAIVYPQSVAGEYASLMHSEYAAGQLIPLAFDPNLQEWVGNVTLPSSINQGALAPLNFNSFGYSGPYDVYVTGISADGTPTSSDLAAQSPFFVQPYLYTQGPVASLTQSSQLAFDFATITASGSLSGDLFLGSNLIQGTTLTITGSQIQGTLELTDSNVTLVGVSGGAIDATNSHLILKDSSIGSMTLDGSTVIVADSSYASVSPSVPTINVVGLSQPLQGQAKYLIAVVGQDLSSSSLSALVDGSRSALQVNATASGLTASGNINATAMNDGVHMLTVTAAQSDGLSSSLTTSFSTNAHQSALSKQLQQLQGLTGALIEYSYLLAAVAIVALVLGVFALRRRSSKATAPTTFSPQV